MLNRRLPIRTEGSSPDAHSPNTVERPTLSFSATVLQSFMTHLSRDEETTADSSDTANTSTVFDGRKKMRHTIRVAKIEDDGDAWAKELVQRIGRTMRVARGGKSAAWLSDRTAELGYRISPTVIAKLDSGHRGSVLSVAELVVLASALNTSPVALVYPGPYDEEVDLFPGERWAQFTAAQWFSAIPAEPYEEMPQWRAATRDLTTWRRLDDLEASRDVLMIRAAESGPDGPPPPLLYKQIEMYDKEIQELKQRIHLTAVERGWGLDESSGPGSDEGGDDA